MDSHASSLPGPTAWPARMVLLAVCGFVVVAPNVGIYYSDVESFNVWRYLEVALAVVVAGAFVLVPAVHRMVLATLLDVPARARHALGAVAVLGIVSAAFAARPMYAARDVALFVMLFLLVIAAAAAARRLGERFDEALAGAVGVAAIFYLTTFLAVLIADPWGTRAWSQNPLVGFVNPRFFGQLQTWTLPLVALPLLRERGGTSLLTRAAFWAAAAGWWMLFLVSGSRAPALALAVGTLVAAACLGRRTIRWLRVQAISLAVGGVAYSFVPGLAGSSSTGVSGALQRGATGTGRELLWRHALSLIERSPLLGVGPGNYPYHRVPPGLSPLPGFSAHPHNALLQVGAEWGILAALFLAGTIVWGLIAWVRSRRADDGGGRGDVSVALTVALFAALIHSCFDGMIVLPLPQAVGAIIVGWALGFHLAGRAERNPDARVTSAAARVAVILAAAALVALLRLPVKPLLAGEQYFPSFWLNGAVP